MRIFFLDDAGVANNRPQDRFFAFGGFSIDVEELAKLRELQNKAWQLYDGLGSIEDELKFSHVGTQSDTSSKPNPLVRIGLSLSERRNFVISALNSLSDLNSIEVIVSCVNKERAYGVDNEQHAIRVLMERIQLSAQESGESVLMICDEVQRGKNLLRDVLHRQDSHYVDYDNIRETIMFAPSNLSPGIQFADLITGATVRMLNHGDVSYFSQITKYVRTNPYGGRERLGYGLTLFPKSAYSDLVEVENGHVPKDKLTNHNQIF